MSIDRGRPTKYRPEMCDRVIELMSEGASKAEVCLELGISKQLLYDWSKKESPVFKQDFLDAIRHGEYLSQGWWEKKGRLGTSVDEDGKPLINATMYIFNMKNRFKNDWADITRKELTGAEGGPVKTENKLNISDLTDDQLCKLEEILGESPDGVDG